MQTNRKYKGMHGHYSKALLHLLEYWHLHDAEAVMDEYCKQMDEAEKPELDEEDVITMAKKATNNIIEESGVPRMYILDSHEDLQGHYEDGEEYFKILPSDTRNSDLST